MLKLHNKEHVAICALTNIKDLEIEYNLSGEDKLEFSLSISDENINLVEEECYITTKNNEYIIKAISPSQDFKSFSCVVNLENIIGKSISNFETSNNNISDTIRLAIAGTGWVLEDNNISKRRTVRLKNTNALEVLREIRKVFRVDFRFDSINKIIHVYEKFGEDRGAYFTDELNLKSFSISSDTYDYITRLYPYGKDGLNISSINNGKEYIENFQYSNKVIERIWSDNRYTDVNSLKEDAEAKLEELSRPKRSYQVEVTDLAKQSKEYSFLDFFLGDIVTLISKNEKYKDKQRIVKYIQYPDNPSKNTCELGNTTLTFEELQKENEYKNQVVENITSDNSTIDGSTVDSITTEQISDFKTSVAEITDLTAINAEITNLKAQNVTITGKLSAIEGEFGTLKANVAVIDEITVTNTAKINELEATKASITQLEAVSAQIGIVEADIAKINSLLAGNITGENIQAGGITSDKLTIRDGFITNAMIANLDVSKVNAGDISTNKFRIKSDDGGIEIVGATQQFKDKNNKVRIQMGRDTQGNFNFIIRGEDGTTTLIDHTGIKEKAIADDLIKENMVSQDAIGEKQINYSSFVTGFNKDSNTNTIKSTKIMLNNENQTLDVAFTQLKTQADSTKSLTESHSTTINIMQGEIKTAINNTKIVKDGQTILLKDDYNRTVQTIDGMKSTIGNHTSLIDQNSNKIIGVQTKTNELERTINSFSSRLSSTETTAQNAINKASIIEQNLNGVTSRVETVEVKQTNIDGKFTNLETRMNSAEQKIEPGAIVSTVTSSQSYIDDLSGKVSSYEIISKINQTPEGIFIQASRLELTGVSRNLCALIPGQDLTAHKSTAKWNSTFEWSVTGNYVPLTEQQIPNTLTYNDTIVISFECYSTSDVVLTPKIFLYDSDKKNITSYAGSNINVNTNINKYTSKIVLDSNIIKATYIFIGLAKSDTSKTIYIRSAFVKKAIGSELIVDGSIKAKHISASESMAIFNKNGLAELTSTSLNFKKTNGHRYMSMENGRFNIFTDGAYMGSMVTIERTSNRKYKGISLFGGYPCYYMSFGVDYNCKSPNDTFNFSSLMDLIFSDMSGLYPSDDIDKHVKGRTGVHFWNKPVSFHSNLYLNNQYLFTDKHRWDAIWSNNNGTYIGSQNRLMFGIMTGNPDTSINKIAMEITPAGVINSFGTKASTDGIDCTLWIDMHGRDIWNTQIKTSSDISLKQNIRYLKDNINSKSKEITEIEIYNSFKSEIDFAEYKYIQEVKEKSENAKLKIGFLANNLVNTTIGDIILEKDCSTNLYSYDQSNYINCIAITLQQEIRKRDKEIEELRFEIENLKS